MTYLTEDTHFSIQSALRVLGLGESEIRLVKKDVHYGRMDTAHLEESITQDKEVWIDLFPKRDDV